MQKNNELMQLENLKCRLPKLCDHQKLRHWLLSLGFLGEEEVDEWIRKYGNEFWMVIYDYWFYSQKKMQADFLIIKKCVWLHVEVKNFDGKFEYKNLECIQNNRVMNDNFMLNMSNKIRRLKKIAKEVSSDIEVISVMVFINEHSQVEISDPVDFDIIMRNEFKQFLKSHNEYSDPPLPNWYIDRVRQVLNKYLTDSPFQPEGLAPERFGELRKGINCPECGVFDVVNTKKIIKCQHCGKQDKVKNIIAHSAKQLRYIFYDNPEMVTTQNIYEFLGKEIGLTTIRRALTNTFRKIGTTRSAYYEVNIEMKKPLI